MTATNPANAAPAQVRAQTRARAEAPALAQARAQAPARRIVVDSCVWIDNYLTERPGARESCAFFDAAFEVRAQLLYPVHAVKDVHYIIAATLKRMEREARGTLSPQAAEAIARTAWACVDNMCESATAVGADEADVWLARKLRALHDDIEDDFVLAASQRAKADLLVTKDARLIAKATVAALTPADATTLLRDL